MTDHSKTSTPDRRLADIVRDVKITSADRTDVVVDMRDADRARLELLAQELKPVIADIDPADDRFDFGISQGLQPRLWVDAVAHVHMGHDRRIFRFVRDTRLGRVIISDTSDMTDTADAVARYIAERVIERERILAGDFEAMNKPDREATSAAGQMPSEPQETSGRPTKDGGGSDSAGASQATGPVAARPSDDMRPKAERGNGGFALGASWFILGCVAGAAALVVAFWDRLSALIN
jgi:hypothetical protein